MPVTDNMGALCQVTLTWVALATTPCLPKSLEQWVVTSLIDYTYTIDYPYTPCIPIYPYIHIFHF